MSELQFTLYIAGKTPRSQQAIANLRRMCEERIDNGCEFDIIDVMDDPKAAESDRILATPTLVKEEPPPLRRITGDLSDTRRVLMGLALEVSEESSANGESKR